MLENTLKLNDVLGKYGVINCKIRYISINLNLFLTNQV